MEENKYISEIHKSDVYITENDKKPLFGPTINYLYNFSKIIYRSYKYTTKGEYDRYKWVWSSYKIMKALENARVKISIKGIQNIRSLDDSAVFISNHMSALETVILPAIIQPVRPVCFIMKKELVKFPFFGPVTAARHPILVGRENPREDLKKVIQEGADRLNNNMSIIVFPQKTRSNYLEKSSFNTLGVKLAKKNNKYVVPVALVSDAWSNGKIIKDFGKIHPERQVYLEFGEPFKVEGNGAEEHKRVVEFISNRFIEWGREDFIRE
ncbi:MAG: 1-acyl-sn-glycerol-3-phosphate acyltransferase [Melioribacteraceae bacterium]|nr:1-acyl-sn-glycerol-3-phosphate acyltransferase [Melioribacteraceae bacterium]